MKSLSHRAWLFVTLLLLHYTPSQASRVQGVSLEEMTQRADRIFSGRCVSVRMATDPDLGQMVTYVTFAPSRVEKGNIRGSVTIKVLGEQDADAPRGRVTQGLPRFRKGEEVVLFLYGDSRQGLTSPVGFGQGKFTVLKDKAGHPLAFNEVGNENLFHGLSGNAQKKLNPAIEKLQGKGLSPNSLLDLVHSLVN